MELVFIRTDNAWAAEFEAASAFNLHIEGVLEGNVRIYQRGVPRGGYALVRNAAMTTKTGIYDKGFAALIYPKWVKVECATEPKIGVVTFGGSVPSDEPAGYDVFEALDGEFLTSDGQKIYVLS